MGTNYFTNLYADPSYSYGNGLTSYYTNLFADPSYSYGEGLANYEAENQQTSLANQIKLKKEQEEQDAIAREEAEAQAEQAKLAAAAQIKAANEEAQRIKEEKAAEEERLQEQQDAEAQLQQEIKDLQEQYLQEQQAAEAQLQQDLLDQQEQYLQEQQAAEAQRQKEQQEWLEKQYSENKSDTENLIDQSTADLTPWRDAGTTALETLEQKISEGPGEFTKSPGYEFRLAEGQKAINNSAAARGGALSGAAIKAIDQYTQDYASKEYTNFLNQYYASLNPLQNLSESGKSAATAMGNISLHGAELNNQLFNSGANALQNNANAYNQSGQFYSKLFGQARQNYANSLGQSGQFYSSARGQAEQNYANALRQSGQYYSNLLGQVGQHYTDAYGRNTLYGGEAEATSIMNSSNIIAAYIKSQQERNAEYLAWQQGNEQARKQHNIFS